jgi:hypothetical protein
MWRSRWAAIGAAIAVSLGAGGLFVAQAAPGPSESTIVTVSPERILDTRDGNDIGLTGPFVSAVSQKLQVTGSIQTATGAKIVVPTGATGVLLNVTPVNPTAAGFISIRPGDATGAATTSSLNFTTGVAGIVPNAVQVAVPTAGANEGEIDITYDAYGQAGPTTDILIDVVGYMTSAGLQELVADVATKAAAADLPTVAISGGNSNETVGTTPEVLRTVTLVPPSNGTVIVQSNANTGNPAGTPTKCSITTGTTIDPNYNQWAGGTTTDFYMLSGLRGYAVQSGVPLTVNLVCAVDSGSAAVFDTNLVATFYATDGVVALAEVPEVASSGGDAD